MPEDSRTHRWMMAAVPCLVGALVYANGLDGPFVFDDAQNVRDNSRIHIESISPGSLWGIVVDSPKRPVANHY